MTPEHLPRLHECDKSGSNDKDEVWFDARDEPESYEDCSELGEVETVFLEVQHSSTLAEEPSPGPQQGARGNSGEATCLNSGSMNDSARDLQVLARTAESQTATSSGRDNNTSSSTADRFPGHRAAFYGETEILLEHLSCCSEEQLVRLDSQGNTVLHVAVLRRQYDTVQALVEYEFPLVCKNARRWLPIDEAVALRDRRMVKVLHAAEVQQIKALHKAKRGALLQTMAKMDDFTFKLKWELGSPIFGLILRRYAPHDTYEVWKKGVLMRVDGSLMGIDDKANTLIPQWKRGHFSLLFDGRPTPATLLLVDHRKGTVVDLTKEKRKHRPDIDDEVSMIMSEGISKTKMKASDFRFTRVKGWLGGDQTERIEGWKTYIYEAAGKMKAVNTTKTPCNLHEGASFEEYLAIEFPEDDVRETFIDPLSLKGAPKAMSRDYPDEHGLWTLMNRETVVLKIQQNGKPADYTRNLTEPLWPPVDGEASDPEKEVKSARTLTGRCWMAEGFPMSLRQLLPILDIVGTANKHLARVAKFLQKYGDMELFPVKLQVPLLFTVYALVSFRNFRVLPGEGCCTSDAFYLAPEGYKAKALHESLSKGKKKQEFHLTDAMSDLEDEDFL